MLVGEATHVPRVLSSWITKGDECRVLPVQEVQVRRGLVRSLGSPPPNHLGVLLHCLISLFREIRKANCDTIFGSQNRGLIEMHHVNFSTASW
jgi:hypothetical protein